METRSRVSSRLIKNSFALIEGDNGAEELCLNKLSCFLCGEVLNYLQENEVGVFANIKRFKELLYLFRVENNRVIEESANDDDSGKESCTKCWKVVKQVVQLNEEMEGIKLKINNILQICLDGIESAKESDAHDNEIKTEEQFVATTSIINNGELSDNFSTRPMLPSSTSNFDDKEEEIVVKLEQEIPWEEDYSFSHERDPLEISTGGPVPYFMQPDVVQRPIRSPIIPTVSRAPRQTSSRPDLSSVPCSICGNKYRDYSGLRSHYNRVHLKVVNYSCPTCRKGYYSLRDVKRHINDSHSDVKHSCSSCGKVVSNEKNLAVHEVVVCNVTWSPERLKRIGVRISVCDFPGCGKRFPRPIRFRKHLKSHSTKEGHSLTNA